MGPHSFFADPDPAGFFSITDPGAAAFFMRIRIQLLNVLKITLWRELAVFEKNIAQNKTTMELVKMYLNFNKKI